MLPHTHTLMQSSLPEKWRVIILERSQPDRQRYLHHAHLRHAPKACVRASMCVHFIQWEQRNDKPRHTPAAVNLLNFDDLEASSTPSPAPFRSPLLTSLWNCSLPFALDQHSWLKVCIQRLLHRRARGRTRVALRHPSGAAGEQESDVMFFRERISRGFRPSLLLRSVRQGHSVSTNAFVLHLQTP